MPRLRSIVARGILALGLAVVACADDGDEATPTPILPTNEITLTASPASSAAGAPAVETVHEVPGPSVASGSRRVGDPEIDRIIEAIEDREVAALAELVEYQVLGCTHALGAGGPPKCDTDQEEGSELRVFPVVGCEGGWTSTATAALGRFVYETRGLFAVAEALPVGGVGSDWPEADAWLVFHTDSEILPSVRLHVRDGRIVALWRGCGAGMPPEEMLRQDGEEAPLIAGPWGEPVAAGEMAPGTGVAAVDRVLRAVETYDLGVLHEAAVRAMNTLLPPVACEEVLIEPGGIECDPSKGEIHGDPVSVFPMAYCEGALTRRPERAIAAFLDRVPLLHSVVEAPGEPSGSPLYPHGAYWLVYEFAGPGPSSPAARLQVTEDGMLASIWFGCRASAEDLTTWDGEPLWGVPVREE